MAASGILAGQAARTGSSWTAERAAVAVLHCCTRTWRCCPSSRRRGREHGPMDGRHGSRKQLRPFDTSSVPVTVVGSTAVLTAPALRLFSLLLALALVLALALFLALAVLLAVTLLLAAALCVISRGCVGGLREVGALTGVSRRFARQGRWSGGCRCGGLGKVRGDAGDRGEYPIGLLSADP